MEKILKKYYLEYNKLDLDLLKKQFAEYKNLPSNIEKFVVKNNPNDIYTSFLTMLYGSDYAGKNWLCYKLSNDNIDKMIKNDDRIEYFLRIYSYHIDCQGRYRMDYWLPVQPFECLDEILKTFYNKSLYEYISYGLINYLTHLDNKTSSYTFVNNFYLKKTNKYLDIFSFYETNVDISPFCIDEHRCKLLTQENWIELFLVKLLFYYIEKPIKTRIDTEINEYKRPCFIVPETDKEILINDLCFFYYNFYKKEIKSYKSIQPIKLSDKFGTQINEKLYNLTKFFYVQNDKCFFETSYIKKVIEICEAIYGSRNK